MRLDKIIEGIKGTTQLEGRVSVDIKGVACDSRLVREDWLFIAVKGSNFDGGDFIDEAIDRGASAVVLSKLHKNKICTLRRGVTFIFVDNDRKVLSDIAKIFYGDISNKMFLAGITGTNGKTTISYLLEGLFKAVSRETGVIGTVNYRFKDRLIPALNTTPGIIELYSLLNSMYKKGVKNCVLEVSSHSLDQGRVDGFLFDVAVFTNLTNEHLDYHKDIKHYLHSKMKLFEKIKKGGHAIINIDDGYANDIIEKVRLNKDVNIVTYGIEKKADVYAKDIDFGSLGLMFKLCSRFHRGAVNVNSSLIGRHNVYNILAAASCALTMGVDLSDIATAMKGISNLPGRLEKIECGQDFLVFVDYAHTEHGLQNVLKALRELEPKRLFTVFGCGGNRDVSKRPGMGRISHELSDKVFITSDNPRNEDPRDIIEHILSGIRSDNNNFTVEIDRFKAIELALEEATKGDIVLIAGKGHETYQIFKDVTLPFDDREVVKKILHSKL